LKLFSHFFITRKSKNPSNRILSKSQDPYFSGQMDSDQERQIKNQITQNGIKLARLAAETQTYTEVLADLQTKLSVCEQEIAKIQEITKAADKRAKKPDARKQRVISDFFPIHALQRGCFSNHSFEELEREAASLYAVPSRVTVETASAPSELRRTQPERGSAGFGVASSSFDLIGAALFGPSALSSEEASQIAGTAEEKARKMRDEKFRRELNQQNLVVHDMADDGNCLFSAVAHQIYNDPELHVTTRAQCYNYMERNRSYYSGFVLEDFDKYLSKQVALK